MGLAVVRSKRGAPLRGPSWFDRLTMRVELLTKPCRLSVALILSLSKDEGATLGYAFPINMPAANTSAPPNTTCITARQNGVDM